MFPFYKNTTYFCFLFLFIIVFSCSNPKKNITKLYGFWEIEQVEFPNGEIKSFTYNNTLDFFYISDSLTGFKQKVVPTINNKIKTSGDSEKFTVTIKNDSIFLVYQTPYATWKETIIKLTNNRLTLKNKQDKLYTYKRYIYTP